MNMTEKDWQTTKEENYCINVCHKGKKAKNKILDKADSIFDAIDDMKSFICKCKETCDKQ